MGRGSSKIGGGGGGGSTPTPAAPVGKGDIRDLDNMTVGQAMQLTDADLMRIPGEYRLNSKYNPDGTLDYATIGVEERVRNVDLSDEGLGTQGEARRAFQTWMSDVHGENVRTSDIDIDSTGITRWLPNGDKQFFSVNAYRRSEIYIEPNLRHGNTLSSKVYTRRTDKGLGSFSFSFIGSKTY